MKSLLSTRRRLLRMGAAGALLAPFVRQLHALCATEQPARRVAFVFFPHGTPSSSGFWPGAGPLGTLTGVMAPLAAHKSRMLIVGGLGSGLEKGYGHSGGNTAALTGRGSSDKDGGYYIPKAPSADWIIARQLGTEPLVLGQKVSGGARLLVSWSEPTKAGATVPIGDPGEAFKRVFGRDPKAGACSDTGGLSAPPATSGAPVASTAVLDVIAADLKAFKAELPSWSRATFDDQLDAIGELQAKAKAAPGAPVVNPAPTSSGGTSEGCYATPSSDFFQHSNALADLIVAAFQGGASRVATFQQGTASGDNFSVPGYSGYHAEVHNLSSGAVGDLTRVTMMQTALFRDIGYFVDRLAATKDVSGAPLIDNTLVYLCTEFSPYGMDSDPHNTGGGLVVALIGASNAFDTTGKAITVKGSVGGLLVHAARYMGLSMGAGLTSDNIGMFAPIDGVAKS
jgi:hypothetical protein